MAISNCMPIPRLIRRMVSSEEPAEPAAAATVFQSMRHAQEGDDFGLHLIRPRRNKKPSRKDIKRVKLPRVDVQWYPPPVIRGSCDGFIIFGSVESPWGYFICNPVTQESVRLPGDLEDSVCGFYFNPKRSEHRLLCCEIRRSAGLFRYYTCDLRLQSRKGLGVFPHEPSTTLLAPAPVTLDGFLYKMTMDHTGEHREPSIMMLDLETECLQFMPAPAPDPGNSSMCRRRRSQSYLLEVEGRRLCYCRKQDLILDIWSLENRASWSWTRTHRINLRTPDGRPLCRDDDTIQPLAMRAGGLILYRGIRQVFLRYDVRTGRFEEIMELPFHPGCVSGIPVATCAMSRTPLSKLNI